MGLSQRRERLIGRLRGSKSRAREAAVLVEGVRAVGEALGAGVAASFAVVSPRLGATEAGARLAERLDALDVAHVDDAELTSLSATTRPQGVMLVCPEPEAGLDRVAHGGRYLVLDGVQDPGNAGTLIRASVAFGLDAVLCLDRAVDPWGPKTVRASAGLIFRIPVVRARSGPVLARLGTVSVPLYVADPGGEDVHGCHDLGSFAIALGNEGGGVRRSLLEAATQRFAVRMPGPAESLNVAMAGSILLHALTRGDEG